MIGDTPVPTPPQETPSAKRALVTPIVTSSTFRFGTVRELAAANDGLERADEFYGRYGNPTVRAAERKVAELERTESALLFASGMAAISAVVLAVCRPGARLVSNAQVYGGARALFREFLETWGVDVALVPLGDYSALERACSRGAALVYVETPANPLCRLVDLARVREIASRAGALLACDATFASPVNQCTSQFGVDFTIQSATKFLGGHSDLLAGTVAGTARALEPVELLRRRLGAIVDPELASRLERSLKTLELRVVRQSESALALARFLERHPAVERVHYPGLPDHPDHALARRQMRAFGGMLSFDVRGGEAAAVRVAESVRRIALAPSLGGIESLLSPPVHTSHAGLTDAQLAEVGISRATLRLSVGLEPPAELMADLDQALSRAPS